MTHSSQSTVGSFINLFSGKWIVDIVCSSLSTNVVSILYRMKLYLLGRRVCFVFFFKADILLFFVCFMWMRVSYGGIKSFLKYKKPKKIFILFWYKHVVIHGVKRFPTWIILIVKNVSNVYECFPCYQIL